MLSNENVKYGYNAATGKYEDLMAAGIIDPTKVSFFFCIHKLSSLANLVIREPECAFVWI